MATDKEKYELNCKMIIKLLNENGEISNRLFKQTIDDDIDDNDDNDDGVDSYIRHIVKNDGITINGELHKWKKYNMKHSCRIRHKVLYNDYKTFIKGFNHKVLNRDDFIKYITEMYEFDIDEIWDENLKLIISFNRDLIDNPIYKK